MISSFAIPPSVAAADTKKATGIEAAATIIIFMDVLCKREASDMWLITNAVHIKFYNRSYVAKWSLTGPLLCKLLACCKI